MRFDSELPRGHQSDVDCCADSDSSRGAYDSTAADPKSGTDAARDANAITDSLRAFTATSHLDR
jgi:hypothetical protein